MYNKTEWAAEKYGMQKAFLGIVGRPIKVLDIEPSQADAIGYTSADGTIHIAYDHPVMDGLSSKERIAFRRGVFAHEMLHQIFTNFKASETAIMARPFGERKIAATIFNVLEDPAIEYWAPTVIGGPLLSSLKFCIAHTYKIAGKINESPSPFTQFLNALIEFGDMGLVKGTFTFPEAKECFAKSAALFNEGILEPDGAKRIEIAAQIVEISRPLWQKYADENEEALKEFNDFLDALKKAGKSMMEGSGSGIPGDSELAPDDKKVSRRKITIKKVTKEELEKLKKESKVSEEIPPEGDITLLVCDEEDEKDGKKSKSGISIPSGSKEKKGKADDKSDSDGKSGSDGDSSDKENSTGETDSSKKDAEGKGKSNSSESSHESTSDDNPDSSESEHDASDSMKNDSSFTDRAGAGSNPSGDGTGDTGEITDEKNEIGEVAEEEYEISDEDIDYIKRENEKALDDMQKEAAEEDDRDVTLEDFDISSPMFGRKTCLNYKVSGKIKDSEFLEQNYNQVVTSLNTGIRSLTSQLKKIFQQDYEEKEYKTSGKIDIKRLNSGRVTSRIFDKKHGPTGKSDLAVTILVDESGSMSCSNRYNEARKCCIALAEVFYNLHIPIYILGFTADTSGYDIIHSHYVTWKNTRKERRSLLNISARANNFDGYSIRYAAKILKKYNAKNRLLIVLSDGQPAAYGYDGKKAIADTKNAIRDAKNKVSVLGVAIGNSDTETLHYMYGADFLHVGNVQDLFSGLSKKIKTIIKGWN